MAHLYKITDEATLVQQLKSSDAAVRNAAFRDFVRLHTQRVNNLAFQLSGNREDADDLTQEVFVRALESLSRFQGISSLATWLHRITVNMHIDYTRSGRYRYTTAWDDARDDDATEAFGMSAMPLPDTSTDSAFQQEHFERALASLPAQQRTVAVLRFVQEYSLDEIAQELGVTVGTVKTLVFRAVRSLRTALQLYRTDFPQKTFPMTSNEPE